MSDYPFKILVNAKTHMVVESQTGRCLGGVGMEEEEREAHRHLTTVRYCKLSVL